MNIRYPENISDEDLWTATNQQPIDADIKKRKWNWIGHTLRKPTGAVEKTALDWNPRGARRCGRSTKTSRKTVEEEAREAGKTWNEVKRLPTNRTRWSGLTDALCVLQKELQELSQVSQVKCGEMKPTTHLHLPSKFRMHGALLQCTIQDKRYASTQHLPPPPFTDY
jgi:hypothetical protein